MHASSPSAPSSSEAPFLQGGGECGALMRSLDWSKTSLGPVTSWPQSLRTLVSTLLASPAPLVLVWGPEFIHLYNDACIPIMGDKHPAGFGLPGRESLAEAWAQLGPLLEEARRSGRAVFVENAPVFLRRHGGQMEEAYFTWSYVPTRGEAGEVAGLVTLLSETTPQRLAERRMHVLRELSLDVVEAATVEAARGRVERVLAEARYDIPFALLYVPEGGGFRLALCSGLERGGVASGEWTTASASPWPLGRVADTGRELLLESLEASLGALPGGAWSEPATRALLLPMSWGPEARARAVLITGLNPLRRLDDEYQEFLQHLVRRVSAILENARARSEASSARERLHAQFMQAPVAVSVVHGPEFLYTLANPLYLEMVGRTDVVGRTMRDVFFELPADAPVFQMLQGVYSTARSFTAQEYCVPLDRKGTGTPEDVYFKFTCQPVLDDAGRVTDIMTVAVDVTEQVRARQRSEALSEQLKLADQRKDEFLAMLAHELRNPMAAISMALSLLERAERDALRSARHRETAQRQMGNLVRLVDDLLDVSRITSGKIELRKEPVDLAVLVRNAVTSTRPVLDARAHALSVALAPGVFPMNADATRVEQIVVNLLTNAAKYTEPGGDITVSLTREGMGARLSVKDTGRGIPGDMLEGVFDLFVQVAPTIDRKTGGLGLGLTLVKRLVGMHGGRVEAFSEGQGRGSEFVVHLPLTTAVSSSAEPGEAAPGGAVESPGRRILLVEDSEDVREVLEEYLRDLGHEVVVARDGLEGVARCLEARPDVALVDVGLPGIDGYEVARRVRASPGGDRPYLVALTGYGGAEARAQAASAGFDLHLTKPVNVAELPRVVARSRPSVT